MINPIIICSITGNPGAFIITPQHPNRRTKVIHLTIELDLLNKASNNIPEVRTATINENK
jgi:hypothetical protein